MSFSTAPKGAPAINTPPATSSRERAVQAFKQAAAAQVPSTPEPTPVPNPSSISPEEMSAVMPPKPLKEEEKSEEEQSLAAALDGQSGNTEDSTEVEAPKEETKPKEELLSQQYAVLARKEKALRAKVQAQDTAYQAKEQALRAREDAIKAKESEYQTGYISKDKITKDPFSTLLELGISYDQLTEMALNQPQTDPATRIAIQKLEAKIEAQEKALNEAKQGVDEQQKNAYKQAINQIRNDAKQLVSKDPEFETIKETGSVDDVVELIEETFKSDGVLLSVEEAAKEVEAYLIEEAVKLMRIKKLQSRFAPAPKQPEAAKSDAPNAPKQQPNKTLTNNLGSSKPMTAKQRAIAAFKGELK